MSLVISETRSSEHEGAFLNFCQAVSDSMTPTPYWDRNLKQFNKVFLKYRAHGKSYLPIVSFAGSRRDVLEAPIVDETGECNDAWLRLPDGVAVPVPPSWLPIPPRGVFLPMKDGEPIHSIPLAEIYARCIEISQGSRSYFGISPSSAPAKFLYLFYQMLHEADPSNARHLENMNACQEMITPVEPTNPLNAIGSLFSQDGIKNMVENVASSFTPESRSMAESAFANFQQSGDLAGLASGFQPILENPGIKNLLASIMPAVSGMMESAMGTVAPAASASAACTDVDPECAAQE